MSNSDPARSLTEFIIQHCTLAPEITDFELACPICLTLLVEQRSPAIQVLLSTCRHIFYVDCFSTFILSGYNSCPCCRVTWFDLPEEGPLQLSSALIDDWQDIHLELPRPRRGRRGRIEGLAEENIIGRVTSEDSSESSQSITGRITSGSPSESTGWEPLIEQPQSVNVTVRSAYAAEELVRHLMNEFGLVGEVPIMGEEIQNLNVLNEVELTASTAEEAQEGVVELIRVFGLVGEAPRLPGTA